MKLKSLALALIAVFTLSSCTYIIKDDMKGMDKDTKKEKMMDKKGDKMMKNKKMDAKDSMMMYKMAKDCTWSPLWFAPIDKDFANIDMLAKKNGIKEVKFAKQKIYPYVLFTRYCTVIKGK